MQKILVYNNRKIDDMSWDVSTPAKETRAFKELFTMLDRDWKVYVDLKGKVEPLSRTCSHCGGSGTEPVDESTRKEYHDGLFQRDLYALAKNGNAKAIRQLMEKRKDYEYEEWHITNIR